MRQALSSPLVVQGVAHRSSLHLARKAWHLLGGLLIVYLYEAGTPRSTAVAILTGVLGVGLSLELLRGRFPTLNALIVRGWGPFMREHELHQMSTMPQYLASVLISVAIFPQPVATLSILYLCVGDPIASFCGNLWGHIAPQIRPGKSWVGTLAAWAVCGAVGFIYLQHHPLNLAPRLVLAGLGATAAAMAESLPLEMDDNFTIPIVSGFVLWLSFIAIEY